MVFQVNESSMAYDDDMNNDYDWMYNQSGVIPIRFREGSLEILLITSRRKKHWVIPKGIIEGELSPQESALEEAYEEAGIRGKVDPDPIGDYQYRKWGGTCTVKVFVMRVEEELETWPEDYFRERRWVDPTTAQALVDNPDLVKLIKAAAEYIGPNR
jgi:8-oxo-dGTP pyrophosphatase MutT (NUDIX family)